MFETVELGRKLSREDYDSVVPDLRTELLAAQTELREKRDFSVVVVIAGVDGAGKGQTVNRLHEWMDPRWLEAHAFGLPTEEEKERPETWRFWRLLPPKGGIGVFFGSWYTAPILHRVYGDTDDAQLERALQQVNQFERALADDGTLVLKFWFHLSKKAQKKRLQELRADPDTRWKVTKRDLAHFDLYDKFVPVCERTLRETSTDAAPWTLVEGFDWRWREVRVGRHVLQAIRAHAARRAALAAKPAPAPKPTRRKASAATRSLPEPTVLDSIDLEKTVDAKLYKDTLPKLQGELAKVARRALKKGVSTVLVFEGADAAGKGGAIRRITGALDARQYRVVPVAAPTDEERVRHYLWRFWRHLPRAGHLVIFDRSWYGRVLVERVEGFAPEADWSRAYTEINQFEELLWEHGIGVAKFWLHVDQDEQARRFAEREQTPWKQFKITEEDYRNREKWPLYEKAVHEMVARTSTEIAPWTLVGANDKKLARLKILETVRDVWKDALKRSR